MPRKSAKKQHGGARPGSGRKPREIPAVVISAKVDEPLAEKLDKRRAREGLTRSAAVTAALRLWLG